MPDDPDPPRKFYQLKPKEYEVVNDRVRPPPADAPGLPTPDPGPTAADTGRIDVRDLFKQANTPGRILASGQRPTGANEVHAVLRDQYAREQALGLYELGPLDDAKRRRRIRNYWIAVVVINVPLGIFAYRIGHGAAIPFVLAIAAMALTTSVLTWQTFFLRTHY